MVGCDRFLPDTNPWADTRGDSADTPSPSAVSKLIGAGALTPIWAIVKARWVVFRFVLDFATVGGGDGRLVLGVREIDDLAIVLNTITFSRQDCSSADYHRTEYRGKYKPPW